MQDTHAPLDSDALDDILEYFFDKYAGDDSILSVTELDGFLAALACAPSLILPSRWMPAIWGGEDQMPDWEEKREINDYHQAVMQAYNLVNQEFLDGYFSPRMLDEKDQFVAMDEWSEGFMRGVQLYDPLSAEDKAILDQHLDPITLFASEDRFKELLSLSFEQIQEKAAQIEPNVLALRQHFFSRQFAVAHTPLMKTDPKVGRNDPCPCGSGKKFKKCCLH